MKSTRRKFFGTLLGAGAVGLLAGKIKAAPRGPKILVHSRYLHYRIQITPERYIQFKHGQVRVSERDARLLRRSAGYKLRDFWFDTELNKAIRVAVAAGGGNGAV